MKELSRVYRLFYAYLPTYIQIADFIFGQEIRVVGHAWFIKGQGVSRSWMESSVHRFLLFALRSMIHRMVFGCFVCMFYGICILLGFKLRCFLASSWFVIYEYISHLYYIYLDFIHCSSFKYVSVVEHPTLLREIR